MPLLPLQPLESRTIPEVFDLDIVAVHGLGGDFFKTWTRTADAHGENDVIWLSQLLPIDLPGARVYSFGYDSGPAFSKSVATIRDFSRQLLQSLLAQSQAVRSSMMQHGWPANGASRASVGQRYSSATALEG